MAQIFFSFDLLCCNTKSATFDISVVILIETESFSIVQFNKVIVFYLAFKLSKINVKLKRSNTVKIAFTSIASRKQLNNAR